MIPWSSRRQKGEGGVPLLVIGHETLHMHSHEWKRKKERKKEREKERKKDRKKERKIDRKKDWKNAKHTIANVPWKIDCKKTNVLEQQLNNLLAKKEFVTFKYIRCAFYLIEDIWNVMNLLVGILM